MQFLVFVVLAVVFVLFNVTARHGMRPHEVNTALSPQELRQVFARSVAGWGWRVVDKGNPTVAESHIAFGIRQRIGLAAERSGERTSARIEVLKYDGQWIGLPREPWTLRMRINSFLMLVEEMDPTARVSG